jgi:hypothetical protein
MAMKFDDCRHRNKKNKMAMVPLLLRPLAVVLFHRDVAVIRP